jgi:hypothetical protein
MCKAIAKSCTCIVALSLRLPFRTYDSRWDASIQHPFMEDELASLFRASDLVQSPFFLLLPARALLYIIYQRGTNANNSLLLSACDCNLGLGQFISVLYDLVYLQVAVVVVDHGSSTTNSTLSSFRCNKNRALLQWLAWNHSTVWYH